MMDQQAFAQACYQQLVNLFQQSKNNKNNEQLKGRVQGFIYAGECLQLIDKTQAQNLMEKAHLDVFGVTVAERKAQQEKRAVARKTMDDNYFDIPAIERY